MRKSVPPLFALFSPLNPRHPYDLFNGRSPVVDLLKAVFAQGAHTFALGRGAKLGKRDVPDDQIALDEFRSTAPATHGA